MKMLILANILAMPKSTFLKKCKQFFYENDFIYTNRSSISQRKQFYDKF